MTRKPFGIIINMCSYIDHIPEFAGLITPGKAFMLNMNFQKSNSQMLRG